MVRLSADPLGTLIRWRAELTGSPPVLVAVVALLLVAAVGVARGGSPAAGRRWSVALLGGCAAWVFVDGSVEGPVLLTLDQRQGVTRADLLVVPFLALAAWRLVADRYRGV